MLGSPRSFAPSFPASPHPTPLLQPPAGRRLNSNAEMRRSACPVLGRIFFPTDFGRLCRVHERLTGRAATAVPAGMFMLELAECALPRVELTRALPQRWLPLHASLSLRAWVAYIHAPTAAPSSA